jgi:hypothetical protein
LNTANGFIAALLLNSPRGVVVALVGDSALGVGEWLDMKALFTVYEFAFEMRLFLSFSLSFLIRSTF